MSDAVLSPAKRELLLRLRGAAPASSGGPVPLRDGTGSPTLVLVHPVGGALFCYAPLTAALETSSPVYAFADAGEAAAEAPEQRIPRLAARYLAELGKADVPRPWVLGGWSFGGVVAYEMARQEDDASRVLLLDAAFVREDEAAARPDGTVRRWFVRDIARLAGVPQERIDRGIADAELEELTGLGGDELDARYRIFEANSHALLAYRPAPYEGPVTLVLAEDSPDTSGDWARFVSGPVDRHVVPGDHYDLLAPAAAERIARIVDEVLRR